MPRRPPAEVRLDRRLSALRLEPHRDLEGVSRSGQRVVDRLEVTRRWPGATAAAIAEHRAWLTDPRPRPWEDGFSCGDPGCCPDPDDLRHWLEVVVRHLPRRDRLGLEELLDRVGERWLRDG